MRSFKLYRKVDRKVSLVSRKILNVVLSKWGILLLFLECWFDGPSWVRRMIRTNVKILLKNLLIVPIFADRSKTLYKRFLEKRKRKLDSIIIGLGELYAMQVISWRKTVTYYRQEPWFKMFVILTLAAKWCYISEYMYIYHSARVISMHEIEEYFAHREPKRALKHRYPRNLNRRIRRWKWLFIRPPRHDYAFSFFQNRMHGYWTRCLHYKLQWVYLTPGNLIKANPIKFYLLVTVYYYLAIWYYHEEMVLYLKTIFFGLIDDWYKVVDDDDVPGGDTIIIEGSRYVVSWLAFKVIKADVRNYFSWKKEIFGKFYDFNTMFIYKQKIRRRYWLKYNLSWPSIKPGINPPKYYSEPTERELEYWSDKYDKEVEEWYVNYNNRLLKNRWPVTTLKAFWVKKKKCLMGFQFIM